MRQKCFLNGKVPIRCIVHVVFEIFRLKSTRGYDVKQGVDVRYTFTVEKRKRAAVDEREFRYSFQATYYFVGIYNQAGGTNAYECGKKKEQQTRFHLIFRNSSF
jgi:hypothetical protein